MPNSVVIVGTGLAGYTLARELRKRDKSCDLTLITADKGESYSKPMLSNALSKNKTADELVMAETAHMAKSLSARIVSNTTVEGIDRYTRRLLTDQGELSYDQLVLALGADPIRLPLKGDADDEVISINDLDDYRHFRQQLGEKSKRVGIIGAGLIGCEFAHDLQQQGHRVQVFDIGDRPLGRLLPPHAAQALQTALSDIGIHWHFGQAIAQVDKHSAGYRLRLSDQSEIETDLVLSAVGLRPRTQLAQQAGLQFERGIVTDKTLRTSDPHIYALGDCAEVAGLVLPFVMPLMHAARALAATLSGDLTTLQYPAMPVVVKTPAYPVVVCPPPQDREGNWREENTEDGVRALFTDDQGQLHGFALTGSAVAEKQALTKQCPDWLD